MNLDSQLYQISKGNEQVFRQLIHQYSDRLFQFACQIVGNREDAQEVISDVFLKIWQLRKRLPVTDSFLYYLYKSVKNTSLNYLKKNNRKKASLADLYQVQPIYQPNKTPIDYIISEENLNQIRHAINALPPRCRQIFILIKEDQLTYKQAADLLDISEATVNVQITIALKKITSTLKPALPEIYS